MMTRAWGQTTILAALVSIACLSTTSAMAQYIWVNEKGVKQYSDMPPPSSIPKSKILKEPGSVQRSPGSAAASDSVTDTASSAQESTSVKKQAPLTTAEKNAEFNKRKMEQAELEKKTAEQEKLAADKAKNCERVRAYHRALNAGERLARMGQNGERQFLDEQQRAQELRDTQRMLEDCK